MALELNNLYLSALVSVLACYQQAIFARKIGDLRRKHKVTPPATEGPAEFVRGFRAQQNCLEFFGIFLVLLWVSAMFFHQVPTAIVGLLYLWARRNYFNGYILSAEERLPGFYMSVNMIKLLLLFCVLGILNTIVAEFSSIDMKHSVLCFLRLAEHN